MENSDVKLVVDDNQNTAKVFVDGYFLMCLAMRDIKRFVSSFDDYDLAEFSRYERCYFLFFHKASA